MIITAFIVLLTLLAFTESLRISNNCNHLYGMRSSRTLICSPLAYQELEHELSNSISNRPVFHINQLDGRAVMRTKSIPSKSKSNRNASLLTKQRQPQQIKWQKYYNELKHFREEHEHCLVPQNYPPNKKLGLWVMQQRRQNTLKERGQKCSLSGAAGAKRIELLNNIGFVWHVRRRGSRGNYGPVGLRRLRRRADASAAKGDGSSDEFLDAVDFEKFMIEKHEIYSDEQMRAAWRQRFEIFQ